MNPSPFPFPLLVSSPWRQQNFQRREGGRDDCHHHHHPPTTTTTPLPTSTGDHASHLHHQNPTPAIPTAGDRHHHRLLDNPLPTKGNGYNVGFGTCSGKILPSPTWENITSILLLLDSSGFQLLRPQMIILVVLAPFGSLRLMSSKLEIS
ncbi:hypothetical protein RHMOL_Rhmol09G0256900 [Rhododendron molle]|uniref:Uncharacterized protein n=1 Tax=Rhododendron molle TaxID=49168 RepID=A0ACC0MJ67_RHOML|nr:hypothetical protein RHMOL_Rhmol09G0256900 [Rhododendron molle]